MWDRRHEYRKKWELQMDQLRIELESDPSGADVTLCMHIACMKHLQTTFGQMRDVEVERGLQL